MTRFPQPSQPSPCRACVKSLILRPHITYPHASSRCSVYGAHGPASTPTPYATSPVEDRPASPAACHGLPSPELAWISPFQRPAVAELTSPLRRHAPLFAPSGLPPTYHLHSRTPPFWTPRFLKKQRTPGKSCRPLPVRERCSWNCQFEPAVFVNHGPSRSAQASTSARLPQGACGCRCVGVRLPFCVLF